MVIRLFCQEATLDGVQPPPDHPAIPGICSAIAPARQGGCHNLSTDLVTASYKYSVSGISLCHHLHPGQTESGHAGQVR